jgi:23S rRNA (cytosine1962-C5)-methyltransferase
MESRIEVTQKQNDYELLDSGEGEKLERFGEIILARPDPQALWKKSDEKIWSLAHCRYERRGTSGAWVVSKECPQKWQITLQGLQFVIKRSSFKHTGIFPEQLSNWKWIEEYSRGDKLNVLNLFGYTGGATLAAARARASVTHVDGSKVALTWARDNAEASGLAEAPIRWILDDARSFVKREIKRGVRYDGIIMDPPAFGRGPKGEVWNIEDDFRTLFDLCAEVLSPSPKFFLMNGYAAGYSAQTYHNFLRELTTRFGGTIESGELAIEETSAGRILPAGIFARWTA